MGQVQIPTRVGVEWVFTGKVLKIGPGIEPDKVLVQRFNGSTGLTGGSTGM